MQQNINSPVIDLLSSHQIAFDVIEIPLTDDKKPVRQLEELLSSMGLDSGSIVRSVLFRGGSEQFFMLALAGGGRADWGLLRKHLGERKLRMAEFDEVPEKTGYVVGAVPPIALPEKIKVLVDDSVNHFDKVVIGSGVLGYAIALKADDLKSLLTHADQGQFVKEAE
ncbi:MAG TPA: YbaK/EbsC family protein [Methylophilaceae bacterium]|nr:YbaK/EbsC family protein [Methylophilaceae bacterium]